MSADNRLDFHVSSGVPAYAKLAGVRFDCMFHDVAAIERAWRVGVPRLRALFGPEVGIGPPGFAPISYGHTNALGCPLHFPADSEVGVEHIHTSLRQSVDALEAMADVDLSQRGMFPYYLDLWRRLKAAMPDQAIRFSGFGIEGPITTAWILRGHEFFSDPYDDLPLTQRLLELICDSLVRYVRLLRQINGAPADKSPDSFGICDDVAAMFPPALWPKIVLPYLDRLYSQLTTGLRALHCENMIPDHVPMLDTIGVGRFDPSVSPRLTVSIIRKRFRGRLLWRINAMQFRDLSAAQIAEAVARAAEDGADRVWCHIEPVMCDAAGAEKIRAFLDAAKACAAGNCTTSAGNTPR